MAKRSYNVDESERLDEEVEIFVEAVEEEPQAPETTRLILLRDLKLNYTGPVTQNLYVFNGAGSVVEVDVQDAQIMLAKMSGKCCPGGSGPQPYFAEEG